MSERAKLTEAHYPDYRGDGYVRWTLNPQIWSGGEYGEDSLIVIRENDSGEWNARTEYDQCVHRDLTEDEIASVRAEFNLMAGA